MSDLFHEGVPDGYIIRVARVMERANWHTYQVLTKRSERLERMLNGVLSFATATSHIWWGVSVEDIRYGVPRIRHLRNTPAEVKFLSIEPLLENLGSLDLTDIDWVIVGGESGPGARPMEEGWVQNVLSECRRCGVPFFFKQWGGTQKKKTGRELQGETYDEFPFTAKNPIPNLRERRIIADALQGLLLGARYE